MRSGKDKQTTPKSFTLLASVTTSVPTACPSLAATYPWPYCFSLHSLALPAASLACPQTLAPDRRSTTSGSAAPCSKHAPRTHATPVTLSLDHARDSLLFVLLLFPRQLDSRYHVPAQVDPATHRASSHLAIPPNHDPQSFNARRGMS